MQPEECGGKDQRPAQHRNAKQSLTDQITVDNKELAEAKSAVHEAQEAKTGAEGSPAVTEKEFANAEGVLKSMEEFETIASEKDLADAEGC